jgi:hypothetical protein
VPQFGGLPNANLPSDQNPCLSLPALNVEVETSDEIVLTRLVKCAPFLWTLHCGAFRVEPAENCA